MKIPSREIPQADNPAMLEKAVRAVAGGATTFQDIASVLGYDHRQGRYYRLAGELLGLLDRPAHNHSVITALGRAFVAARGKQKTEMLAVALMKSRFFQRVVTFLQSFGSRGTTRPQLEGFIGSLTETTPSMVARRASTVVSWLEAANLITERAGHYIFGSFPKVMSVVDYAAVEEPLLPRQFTLKEYEAVAERTGSARGFIKYEIARAEIDRANSIHETLTKLVADKIRAVGSVPKRNPLIDLAAEVRKQRFIFEIKTTPAKSFRAQVRRGVSQLYEYRYLQAAPDARLVLVIEHPLPAKLDWMRNYLTSDRDILLAWDGDLKTLHCSREIRDSLEFLL